MSTISNQSSPLLGGTRGACSFFRAPASSIVPYKDISLVDIYHYITGPYAAERTAKLRSIDDKKTKGLWKRTRFDYVTFSGTFTTRRDDALVAHSGYLCLDFDHLVEFPPEQRSGPDIPEQRSGLDYYRRLLLQDPHFETLLLFTSPSGTGLKWVIPIDLEKATNEQWYIGVSNYLRATYGLQADPACANVSRSCFLPHDPDCYIAPRLLPELSALDAELAGTAGTEGALIDLATRLGATNICITSKPDNND